MKKYTIFAILAAGLLPTACNITEIPEDRVTPDVYFRTATDLRSWTDHFYNTLPSAETLSGMNADDMVDRGMGAIIEGTRMPSDAMSGALEWNFNELRRINYFLEHC
ncbi:MAG: RagB/SusD family nutrient uptake outer membrane protein, partial [Bacteroidales bacterium]|nr:RagB/SusD family nutrient uptake outer membrane protein [Bacteroidales bacterium]